ncbi:hypothetical protein SKAU_G00059390 [Synaphobranchus kaupii]|uniref:Iodothyronine deiodinase n=1 Tax=Synaphobranchus kaupii TaxID=118154 RepID=A0A9Q1J8E8_SYNKA|nr:hypothetical protein SKAU_G00059390 [Synaphobranchus kaupii]
MGKLVVYLTSVFLVFFMVMQTLILRILSIVAPGLTKRIMLKLGERVTMTQNPKFKYEDWGPTFATLTFVKTVFGHIWLSLGDEAFVGDRAPDTPLVTLDGKKGRIYDFLKDNRPLLVKDFGAVADFLVVYIAEAHATDGWSFSNNVDIKKHTNLQERLAAAQVLLKENPLCPIVVDDMTDITASKYGALPERLYVLLSGKVIYKGKMGPWGYNPEEVRRVLEKIN